MMESIMGLLRESYPKIRHCSRASALRRALKHVSSRRLVTARKFQCDWGFHLMRRFAHAAAPTRRRAWRGDARIRDRDTEIDRRRTLDGSDGDPPWRMLRSLRYRDSTLCHVCQR